MIIVVCFGPEVGAFSAIDPSLALPDGVMIALVVISAILTLVALASYIPGVYSQLKERHQAIKNGTWDKKKNQFVDSKK